MGQEEEERLPDERERELRISTRARPSGRKDCPGKKKEKGARELVEKRKGGRTPESCHYNIHAKAKR